MEVFMPKIDIFKPKKEDERQTIVLTITNNCNLKCKYCYEQHQVRKNETMDFDTAKNIITKYMNQDDKFDLVEIQFFGGEPLLAFPLIKETVEWFHSQAWKKNHVFFIPTNGTLLTGEMKEWLASNRHDVKLGFSLDGNKTAHNLGRDNSYDLVMRNFSFFKENWPEQAVKMTIYEETIPHIADSIIELEEKGILFAANVVFENTWKSADEKRELLKIYEDQLSKLVDYYCAHTDLVPVSLVDKKIEYLADPKESKENKNFAKFCGAGVQTCAFDVNGEEYPSQRFIPSFNNHNTPPEGPVNERSQWQPEMCSQCKLLAICPSCVAFNWQENNNPDIRTTYHCESFKLEVLASAKLQALRISEQVKNAGTDEEKAILGSKIRAIVELVKEGV